MLLLTERLLWSCCGCRWFPLPMRQEQPHFQVLLTTRVFTINCLACVTENFLVTRQGYAAQCRSQTDTKASITETVQAEPPEKVEIFPLLSLLLHGMQHLSLWQHLECSVEHITVTFTCAVCLFLRLHARDAGLGRDIALLSREPVGHQCPSVFRN